MMQYHYGLSKYCNNIAIYYRGRKPPKQRKKITIIIIYNNIEFFIGSIYKNVFVVASKHPLNFSTNIESNEKSVSKFK